MPTTRRPVDARTLSLGHTMLEANGHKGTGRPVVVANFVTNDPRLLLSDPKDDSYLTTSIVAALRDGEIGLTPRLIPGLREHYERLGLLPRGAEVIEVDPRLEVTADGRSLYSHANTDPITLSRTGAFEGTSAILASYFSSDSIHAEASRAGLQIMDRPDSTLTNNKARIRDDAVLMHYGINPLPGAVLTTYDDASRAATEFSYMPHGMWMKLALGSGGDYVAHIRHATAESIIGIRDRMYNMARAYYGKEGFGHMFDAFWPSSSFSPTSYPFIIECDAGNMGEVVHGNTQAVTHRSGDVDVISHSDKIMTPGGSYIGSMPLRDSRSAELRQVLREGATRVGRFNIGVNGYYGIQGIDWFVAVDRSTGRARYTYYLSELNSRPIITTPATIIASKLGCDSWINTNLFTRTQINDIGDFTRAIGASLTDVNGATPREMIGGEGLVIPVAFRSLVTSSGRAVTSPDFKVLICGRDEEHTQDILVRLEESGISLTPLARK